MPKRKSAAADPNVAAALSMAIDAVIQGAGDWILSRALADTLRKMYYDDFKIQVESGNWPSQWPKVLRVARHLGAVAAFFAEWDVGPTGSAGHLTKKQTLMAARLVQIACSAGSGKPGVTGKYCQTVATKDFKKDLDAKLQKAIDTKPIVVSGAKAKARTRKR